jgi:hypothetical protein
MEPKAFGRREKGVSIFVRRKVMIILNWKILLVY